MTRQIKLDVFSDPACPWCLIGLARLDRAIANLPEDVSVTVAHHPYLLDANAPKEGVKTADMLREKYGRDPEPMWERVETEARKAGVALDMRKQTMRYASQPAEALIAAAAGREDQHKLARAIGDAYYLEARNIGDAEVLADVGGKFGFARDEAIAIATDATLQQAVEQAAAEASQQGIQGVPFFIFDSKYALSGAQPDEVFQQVFGKLLEEAAPVAD